jgi:hypothetical protein
MIKIRKKKQSNFMDPESFSSKNDIKSMKGISKKN